MSLSKKDSKMNELMATFESKLSALFEAKANSLLNGELEFEDEEKMEAEIFGLINTMMADAMIADAILNGEVEVAGIGEDGAMIYQTTN